QKAAKTVETPKATLPESFVQCRHFGLCGGEPSTIGTRRWSLSCISQTDYRSRGDPAKGWRSIL
ncbi:MAG: hypothetical protein WCQ21_37970, partial [Verrucomicrobiota bacterium]